jgi:hypothetical protein
MSFPQLQKYKGKGERLDNLISQIEFHLTSLLSKYVSLNTLNQRFNYKKIVVETNLSKEQVLPILEILRNERVLVAEYHFYCPDKLGFIEKYHSLDDVPQFLECYNHNRLENHEAIDCDIEILFGFSPEIIESLGQVSV